MEVDLGEAITMNRHSFTQIGASSALPGHSFGEWYASGVSLPSCFSDVTYHAEDDAQHTHSMDAYAGSFSDEAAFR